MGNEIFEEIKKKYKKSNKYMLCVSYEDIGILIQIIETMNKRKLQDMTFEYFNDNELQAIVGQYLTDFLKEIIKKDYISKKKLYKHIKMLEKENCGLEKLRKTMFNRLYDKKFKKIIGGITMVEEIEETLQEKFENLKIEVEYVKIKMYSIKIGTKTIFYKWQDNLTFSANIEQIVYYIKIITGGTQ